MITLYTFGPYFGLPDPSPFVTKALLLLKFAGLPFEENRNGFAKAPKGKLPYIDDDGERLADSTFIRFHIEKKYGFDFDAGLSAEQTATGWALEKMCEDHLYWLCVGDRWLDDANFQKGPAHFFEGAPAPIRPLIQAMIRRKVRRAAYAQGLSRHSSAEQAELARRGMAAVSVLLADKPFLFGDSPRGADATIGAFMMGLLCPVFESASRAEAESHPNLVAYRDRIATAYFPNFAQSRGSAAPKDAAPAATA
jgi:glutathione S-transferase